MWCVLVCFLSGGVVLTLLMQYQDRIAGTREILHFGFP